MSALAELLQKYCPNGVPFMTLDDLGTFCGGLSGKSKNDFIDGNAKFITYKNVYSNPALEIDVEDKVVIHPGEKQRTLEYGDVIFTGSSETPEECGMSSVVNTLTEEALYLNSFCFVFRFHDSNVMLPDFSKHLFRSHELRKQIIRTANGVTRYNVSKKLMGQVVIPVPPLAVQREIVHILDSFMSLTAELQAELQAGKRQYQQYEYYASSLYTRTNADWIPMSELASFVYGYTDKAQNSGDARFIRITDIDEQGHLKQDDSKYIVMTPEAKKSLLRYGDLVMARTGATYGKTLFFENEEPSVFASFLIKITPNEKRLLNRYYWHFTKTLLYWEQANKLVTTGGQPQFNTPAIKQVRIPVPGIKEQERIASILDRLDALCNDISAGLPAEIEARQKQYEYYRDKLLTFKELS